MNDYPDETQCQMSCPEDDYLRSAELCDEYLGSGCASSEYPDNRRQDESDDTWTRDEDLDRRNNGQTGLLSEVDSLPGKPLNIVCIGPSFCVGGVEQHIKGLAKFLNPQKARITACLVTDPDHLTQSASTQLPFAVRLCVPALLSQLTADSDVILMWGQDFNGCLSNTKSLRVFVAHGESWWTRKRLEESSGVIDHVIAVSGHVRQKVCHGFPATTILNGVDTARLTQSETRESVRERLGFSPGDFVLGSVGRLTREKQFHLLIDATAILPHHFKLLLVGSGRREHELLKRANQRIPGRYAFVSASSYLGDYYKAMDAFGLVSEHEGFGMVIPEAMLCETPVFATNVGCVPEVIRHRVNGLVVSSTRESIASAAVLLQSHPHWARGMAKEASIFALQQLNAKRMARDYENLFLNLIAARCPDRERA